MNSWIRVKDRLPADCECVLIWSKGFEPISAALNYDQKGSPSFWRVSDWDESDTTHRVDVCTHWMPLPTSPEEFEEEMLKFTQGFAYEPKHEKEKT